MYGLLDIKFVGALTNWPKSQLPLRFFEVVGDPISLGNTLAEEVCGFQHISTQRTIDFTKHLREPTKEPQATEKNLWAGRIKWTKS